MQELRDKLASSPRLTLSYVGGRYTQHTDVGKNQVSCVQFQKQPDGTTKGFGYRSCSVITAKQAYNKTQRECVAIV